MSQQTDENESAGTHEQQVPDGVWQAEIIRRSLEGDEQAFAVIVDKYGSVLLRTAYLLLRDQEAAQDVVQESFLLAWKNLSKLREPSFLRAWLLKIVVNQSMTLKRQIARGAAYLREQLTHSYVEEVMSSTSVQRGEIEDRLDLTKILNQLPLKQRTVVVLFYYHKLTMVEIASMLGESENTLRKRLQSALEKMRRVLQVDEPVFGDVTIAPSRISIRGRGKMQ